LPSIDNAFARLGEIGHEALKRRPELVRVEHAEKPAERIVARHAFLEPEKPAQERLLRFREQGHVHRTLRAAQNRAHRDRQNLMSLLQNSLSARDFLFFTAGRRVRPARA
jgi:hypothetical protein